MIKAKKLLADARNIQGVIILAEASLRTAQDKLGELILSVKMLEMEQNATVVITSGSKPKVALDSQKIHAMAEKPDAD